MHFLSIDTAILLPEAVAVKGAKARGVEGFDGAAAGDRLISPYEVHVGALIERPIPGCNIAPGSGRVLTLPYRALSRGGS